MDCTHQRPPPEHTMQVQERKAQYRLDSRPDDATDNLLASPQRNDIVSIQPSPHVVSMPPPSYGSIDKKEADVGVEGSTKSRWLYAVAASIAMGLVFGAAMDMGKVTLPLVIREQFIFKRFIMLKMFLGASGSSAFFIAILSIIAPREFEAARTEFMGCVEGKGIFATGLGAFILGCGMALAGSCPGMVLVQLGSGVANAYITLIGGLCAGIFYGIAQPYFLPLFPIAQIQTLRVEELPLFSSLKYWQLAMIMFAMLAIVVVLLEVFFPWESSTELPSFTQPWKSALPPELMGVFIGMNQIPAILFIHDTLGSSSAYMTCTSQALVTSSLQERFIHWSGFRTGLGNIWQPVYLAAAIIGALISSTGTGTFGKAAGVTPAEAFFGGFLAILGSRIASGCTSGHGLSGIALLSVKSILAVPLMFAGGILVGYNYDYEDPMGYRGNLMQ
eukprot:761588-Hanusia_phi.AAC.2